MKIKARILAYLLHVANSNPPGSRGEFYAMKDAILKRYATFDGSDIQRIVKECWGYGWWEGGEYIKCGPNCRQCGGSGIFDVKYFELTRWRIGGYLFHSNPTRLYCSDRHALATIHGRVKHKDYGHASDEAALWLSLLTGRWAFFWNETKAVWRYGRKAWPLLNLGCLCWFAYSIYRGLKSHKCYCGRTYRDWWFGKSYCCVCRTCRMAREVEVEEGIEEVPF